ncbi:MAG: hypothetical protein K2H81_03875 [Alistipes sp.]|nr:hypothetical protein [Alistipes sp.]
MKKRNSVLTMLAALLLGAGCSSSFYASDGYEADDLYGVHDRERIAAVSQQRDRVRQQQAEARRARRMAEEAGGYYYDADGGYGGVLADTYESAYARRLRGFASATYRMPASYFDLRYGGSFHYLTAYDPASYNIIVMGDQAWVEPKYITSMFGSWGSSNVVTFGFGIYDPWYSAWGYNPYWYWGGWNYPGWGWGWGPGFGSWWGPGYWWDPYHWGHHPGWGGGHDHYHPAARPAVVHRGQYRYAPGAGSSAPIRSGSFIDRGSVGRGYRNGTTVSGGSRPASSAVRPGISSSGRQGSSSTYRSGNVSGSSYRSGSSSNSTYRGSSSGSSSSSSSSSGSSYRSGSSSGSRPTYSAPASSGGGARGGSSGGRNSYGR